MNRSNAHRWLVVALLLCRLVLGEFAHALPAHAVPADAAGPVATPAHDCEEHEQGSTPADDEQVSKHGHAGHTGKSPCCQSSVCECPGLHTPALGLSLAVTIASMPAVEHSMAGMIAIQRLSAANLFRPPIA